MLSTLQHIAASAPPFGKQRRAPGLRLAVTLSIVPGLTLAQTPGASPLPKPPDALPLTPSPPGPDAARASVALRWDGAGAPEGCLGEEILVARIEDFLGRRAFDAASPRLLRVRVEPTAEARLRAVVTVGDNQGGILGEREIVTEDASCEALEEPLVLAIALLADADLGVDPARRPAPEPPPPPEPEAPEDDPAELAPDVTALVVAAPPRPPDPWRAELDASVAAVDGLLPSFGFGAELGFFVDPPWSMPLRARVAGWAPQREALEPRGNIDFRAGIAGLMLCPLSERSSTLGVDVCAGADLVAQHAESQGLEGARASTQWFAQGALALRAVAELPGPWYATLSAGLGAPIRPPAFVYYSDGERTSVYQAPEGVLHVTLGLGVRVVE